MLNPNLPEPELIKVLLEPLFEDFHYWLGRADTFLETETVEFLTMEHQADLLERVKEALREVAAAQSLFKATEGQVGVDPQVLLTWHQLISECWQVMIQFRLGAAEDGGRTYPNA
ncbi:DUF2605 family protein [Synechococcales cyanobacterium C]|uniref:DUF2605 family protein n=1 Tax=Petrachloros mirabilis ULC683 TaxID=2781853 RepID=A0A8K2A158_9CYAN|nr:DUF2605 domain-containing protein [Petrachloros mirabilis]NCJ08583.1 DUF2605 family protein [Petrachloros mirabilis ULC683]